MKKLKHQEFTCSRGSLRLRGSLFRPAEGERLPIAVVSHEYMANRLFTRRYARLLASLGYAAFCYDFSGGCIVGGSQGKTTDMTVFTEMEDLKAVIAYAKAQPYTDPDRLLLMGCSQGGLVTALTAAELGEEAEAIILFYPALSIPDDARKGSMMRARFDPKNIPETMRCGPMKLGRAYAASVLDLDPLPVISSYHGDVLLVHGNADQLVDISYSRRAYDAYRASAKAALEAGEITAMPRIVFHEVEGAGHIFTHPKHNRDAVRAVTAFLADRSDEPS
ncbi:MAG: prolyl oligopeptidase family serine peptidase [Oscillospiraceae bacterium]|nr:prolyl oligopeptidase family serine peptidase [Oscillospiraceae bacterium]